MVLSFTILKGSYAIYRMEKDSIIPDWIPDSEFYSITRTVDELSVVCRQVDINADDEIKIDKDWRLLKINGPLDLSLVGIIADISGLLGESNIPIFTISTYDTDYILIKNQNFEKALKSLRDNGHNISQNNDL